MFYFYRKLSLKSVTISYGILYSSSCPITAPANCQRMFSRCLLRTLQLTGNRSRLLVPTPHQWFLAPSFPRYNTQKIVLFAVILANYMQNLNVCSDWQPTTLTDWLPWVSGVIDIKLAIYLPNWNYKRRRKWSHTLTHLSLIHI